MRYLTRDRAAAYLAEQTGIRLTSQALADRARAGTGPRYAIIGGRAVYTIADLDAWLVEQAARPVVRRSAREAA